MSRSRILSDAQIDEMAELREQGWSYRKIADRFAAVGTLISAAALHWQCLRVGADAPPEKRVAGIQRVQPYRRGERLVCPFSPEDDALLLVLDAQAFPLSTMARRMGRRPNSIKGRLMTLARREARAEEALAA